ncbi:MAG: HIT family protein [Candidatus Saccharimonadales bacterium]
MPCHKIYEDEHTFAFLDIHPVQTGMVLVVSKMPAETFLDLSDIEYRALWKTVKKIGQRLHEAYPTKRRIAVQVEGLDVPHVHVKLFPIDSGDEFRARPNQLSEPPHQELAAIAQKIAF